MKAALQPAERRKFPRHEAAPHFGINLLQSGGAIAADQVNFSEGGLCLRLEEMLEVRSMVRLQLTAEGSALERMPRPLECAGRVAWVIQRSDLRSAPPFLFDVGVEFVDPPLVLRQLMADHGFETEWAKDPAGREKTVEPLLVRNRRYVPRLERMPGRPMPWHLVVLNDGVPCFSGHYPSQRAALAAWDQFKRQQVKR